eukprot:Colp12_sorted_trinity150504_noHs@18014
MLRIKASSMRASARTLRSLSRGLITHSDIRPIQKVFNTFSTFSQIGQQQAQILPAIANQVFARKLSTSRQKEDVGSLLCRYATERNLDELRKLVDSGVDVNRGDYDARTALHLAAAEGHTEIVAYLISAGANVNVIDRFGGTPLSDALKGRHSEVAALLRSKGARISVRPQDAGAAMCQAAAVGDARLVQFLLDTAGVDINSADYDFRTALHLAAATGQEEVVQLLLARGADVHAQDRFGNTALDDARRGGHHEVADFLSKVAPTQPRSIPKIESKGPPQKHLEEVTRLLMEDSTYNDSVIAQEVDWYYNQLSLQRFYYERFTPREVASHIQSYIAAKRIAAAAGNPNDVFLTMERADGGFYLCPTDHRAIVDLEKNIERMIDKIITTMDPAYSLTYFRSKGVAVPHGRKHLGMFILDKSEFVDPKAGTMETDIHKVATKAFLQTKTPVVVERYREIMAEAVSSIGPVVKVYPAYKDGTIPLMFAFKRANLNTSLSDVTELFEANSILCERKMVESFANDVVVLSLYVHPKTTEQINDFVNQVAMLFLVPKSKTMTPLYLSGELTAKEYAYASNARKFIYYFLNQDNEDLRLLMESLRKDTANFNRLLGLRQKLKRDTISEPRIAQCIARYPDMIKALYKDFYSITAPGKAQPGARAFNTALAHQIDKEAVNDVDRDILREFLKFNSHVLKTNFHMNPKASIAFRLDPSFMSKDYNEVPYGLFFVMANDFIGFHVRFSDVARGGIRLIKSANNSIYNRNFESVLAENYNLAHTQNKKNKDIPEFGSKGTILLNSDSQNHAQYAFKKYISGLIDLLMQTDQVVDHHGKQEILFLGPDENTADLMEWAALYAKERGYSYWKAFTTGKPPSLGGIPHDVYGMTTRSVHKYVTESLKLKGLEEDKITKLQTGGPDGDLGSNEILISKDNTIAIVDGSGVLYDPEGLDRTELTRLAKNRQMIRHFQGNLSNKGFLVLVEDRDKRLPNDELVESGLVFRNEFHLNPLSSADLFVPCGGRPEAVNAKNVHRMFHPDGTPRFKMIVEGANLFLTQEARLAMEQAGVILFKDASANKGGVTSSSMEVLAALSLTDAEFHEHMCVRPGEQLPAFYQEYVKEVQTRIEENAFLEFHCITNEHERTKIPRHLLTDQISDKINKLNEDIANSKLYTNDVLRENVLSEAIPHKLVELVGGDLNTLLARLPPNYTKAIFSSYIASRFIYKYGLKANEFAFFEYISEFYKDN